MDDAHTAGVCRSGVCVDKGCGDGKVEPDLGEECDDGVAANTPTCNIDCTVSRCGDGKTNPAAGEQCDPGASSNCRGSGSVAPCTIPVCGDGIVDAQSGEECDKGSANSLAPNTECRPNCVLSHCGDGVVDDAPTGRPAEVCDDGNTAFGDGCSGDCESNETCGNGYIDSSVNEQCDDDFPGLSGTGCASVCTIELPQWSDTTPQPVPGRTLANLAYDSRRHQMILFGGTSSAGKLFDTWKLVDDVWQPVAVQHAPSHADPMVFDPDHNVVLMVADEGRIDGSGTRIGDTWVFDGLDWKLLAPATSPTALSTPALAYDTMNHRTLFVGSNSANGGLNETWSFDGTTWTQLFPTHRAPQYSTLQLAFDPAFGSRGETVALVDGGETWTFDGSDWTQVGANEPTPDTDTVLAYDASSGQLQLTGFDQTWVFDGSTWTQTASFTATMGTRIGSGIAVDPDNHRLIMFGGLGYDPAQNATVQIGDTWQLVGSSWTQIGVFVAPSPENEDEVAAAYDPLRGQLVELETELGAGALTWTLEPNAWRQVADTPSSPPRRSNAAMAFAPNVNGVILFGGTASGSTLGDTWLFDGSWRQIHTATTPDTGESFGFPCGIATPFTPASGGAGVLLMLTAPDDDVANELWSFDGSDWALVTTNHTIPNRVGAAMVFDEAHGDVVLFGGFGNGPMNETWVFDGSDWSQRHPAHSPPARSNHIMVYDPASQRVVLFGGGGLSTLFNDVWTFDGSDWTQLEPPFVPPLGSYAGGFDRARGELVVFGGFVRGGPVADVWTLKSRGATPIELCEPTIDSDGDGLVGCADPDCAGFCTPTCTAYTDRYDHRPITASHPAPPHCDLSAAPFCGDGICQSPLEDGARCPGDCP